VIRIDQLWLCTAPMDMRAGAERLMSCVVKTTGAARAHHGYLFANARATRIKLLVHDGLRRVALERWSLRVAARSDARPAVAHAEPVRRPDRGPAVATTARDERDHADVSGVSPSSSREPSS
jgi:IS66 Orf2 like protein